MALIKCKECGKDISDTAKICINCGAKTEKAKNQITKVEKYSIILIIIILIISSMILININNPINKYKKEAIEILEDLKDNKITIEKAENEIEALQKEFDKNYADKIENNTAYFCFSLDLSSIQRNLYLDGIKETPTNIKINEYIDQIKK